MTELNRLIAELENLRMLLQSPPIGAKKSWREVFGVRLDWRGDLPSLFREKAKQRHPDSGGSDTLMAELNVAYEEARREFE